MAVKYLKKKELYQRAKMLIDDVLPLCKDFSYCFFRGVEIITGGGYEIHSMYGGNWLRLVHIEYDETDDLWHFKEQIFAHYQYGKYTYTGKIYMYTKEKGWR